jgi:protein TonB
VIGLVDENRTGWTRWLLSAAIVVMAHGTLAAAIMHWNDDDDPDDPASAMVMDLAPFLAAPANRESELPPGPEQVQAEATPEVKVEKVEEKPEEKVEVAEIQEPEAEIPPTPDLEPEVVLAALPPKPEPEPEPPKVEQPPAPVTTAPAVPAVAPAAVAVAPTQGPLNVNFTTAHATWLRQVSALLERSKRYPAAARGAEGTVHLNFALDRQGRVTRSRIVKGSGFSVLDQEALNWVQRAQPFPLPPTDVPDEKLSMTVPYRFNVR